MRGPSIFILLFILLLTGTSSAAMAQPEDLEAWVEIPKIRSLEAWDKETKVGLYIPAPLDTLIAYEIRLGPIEEDLTGRSFDGYLSSRHDVAGVVQSKIVLSFEPGLRSTFEAAIRKLFPRAVSAPSPAPVAPLDLLLVTSLEADWTTDESARITGVWVRVRLTVLDSTGMTVDTLEGSGQAPLQDAWTRAGSSEEAGEIALRTALAELVEYLRESPALAMLLKNLAEGRSRPAGLVTTVRFDDGSSLFPDGQLDAGDEGSLLFQVSNLGPGPAYAVAVRVIPDRPEISVSGPETIGDLRPGQKSEIGLRIRGRLDLPSTGARLRIETSEKRGYGAQPVLFELPTGKLVPPQLEIVDVALNDQPSRNAYGDGDGQPANGETMEAIVRIRNAGPGEAAGVAVFLTAPQGTAEILETRSIIPRIAANCVEEARLLLRLPIALQASELSLSFRAVEARGAQVASVAREQTWKIRTKRPGIELAYRIYDGTSAGSIGNRDGLVNNGERIEVAVTPTNRGELPARGVRIAVESSDPRLVPRPAAFEIGDLPLQAEGAVQRFAFEVPRDYGKDRSPGDLLFTLSIAQQSFPAHQEPVVLTFRSLRPKLALEMSVPPSLARGADSEIALRLRNAGTLRAEDVIVEITSDAVGLDLLDERGVPVRARKIALGALEPQGLLPERRVKLNVRRSAAIGPAPLRISVSQKDFSSLAQNAEVTVTEEPAAVVATAPREGVPQSPSLPAPAAPATISFLRNTPGEHLLAEAIVLRFEVQTQPDLAEVRLTQNERLLPIDAARRIVSATGGLQVVQYEIPVQLEEGENRFEVVAVTRQGIRTARPLTLFRDREVGRLWVVAIGVSKYQNKAIRSLQYANADAQAVHAYFRDTFGLPESQIFLRINEQATLREIKSVLGTRLAARANDPRDTVILYFAGHGMRERVTGNSDADGLDKYFLPYDADRNDLFSTALDMDEVTNILRRLTPERVVVLLDSCFSGAAGGRSPFDPKTDGERALITDEFLDRMAHVGKGRVVMTASGPEESAQESADFGHGVFTYYLLDGLRGAADLSGDGEIDVHEVYRYVSDKVSRTTRGKQNPKLKEPDLVGRILLGRGAVRSQQ
jgi:hypothetical protein